MKMWSAPSVEEMNIAMTANGFFCCDKEVCFLAHEHKGCDKDDSKTDDVAES